MYAMYEIDKDGKTGTIVAVSDDPASAEVWENGIWVEDLPVAAPSAGRTPCMKIDLETKELYYIYVDSTGQTTNDYVTQIKQLRREVEMLKTAVDGLLMGGL